MHGEVTDCYFNVFFVDIQLENQILKSIIWPPKPVYLSPKGPGYVPAFETRKR